MALEDSLDVIVRFHDVRRMAELNRCIFSLVCQDYRPLQIYLVLQRFSAADIEATKAALAPLLAQDNAPGLTVLNCEMPEPADARSVLMNVGFQAIKGRYLAILDYDDVLYPEAYELLVRQLRVGGAVIAFATVCVKRVDVYDTFFHAVEVLKLFEGSSLRDLFVANFCPIHSFVMDRSQVPTQFLTFEPILWVQEDYDFLLRICARYPSDFTLIETCVGDYYYKTDGSNTVPTEGGVPEAELANYNRAVTFIEQRRRTVPLALEVQRSLGIVMPEPGMTIRDYLDRSA
jgi:hypothetical protein